MIPWQSICYDIISTDIISVPNEVSAHPGTKCHIMYACGHDIISTDIISVPNEVSAHPGTKCHIMYACGHDITMRSEHTGANRCFKLVYSIRSEQEIMNEVYDLEFVLYLKVKHGITR